MLIPVSVQGSTMKMVAIVSLTLVVLHPAVHKHHRTSRQQARYPRSPPTLCPGGSNTPVHFHCPSTVMKLALPPYDSAIKTLKKRWRKTGSSFSVLPSGQLRDQFMMGSSAKEGASAVAEIDIASVNQVFPLDKNRDAKPRMVWNQGMRWRRVT